MLNKIALVLGLLVVAAGVLGGLYWYGYFNDIILVESYLDPSIFIYKEYSTPYQNLKSHFYQLNKSDLQRIKSEVAIAIFFFDNTLWLQEKEEARSALGFMITGKMDDEKYLFISQLLSQNYKQVDLPAIRTLSDNFPYRNFESFMFLVKKSSSKIVEKLRNQHSDLLFSNKFWVPAVHILNQEHGELSLHIPIKDFAEAYLFSSIKKPELKAEAFTEVKVVEAEKERKDSDL
jgi:hypothetical protein